MPKVSVARCREAALLLALAVATPAAAQVKVTRILDTPETRVVQVEIPANDTRPLHMHPEAMWHVYVTTDAPMDLLIEGHQLSTSAHGRRTSSKEVRLTASTIRTTGQCDGSRCSR